MPGHDHHNGHEHHGDPDHAGHDHGRGEHHHHQASPAGFDRAFAIGSALNPRFVVAEVVFGLTAHSVALLADAAHNLGDELGLLLPGWAAWLGRRHPTQNVGVAKSRMGRHCRRGRHARRRQPSRRLSDQGYGNDDFANLFGREAHQIGLISDEGAQGFIEGVKLVREEV